MRRIARQPDHSPGPARLAVIAVLALIALAVLVPGVLVARDAGNSRTQASSSAPATAAPTDAGAGEPSPPATVEEALERFRRVIEEGLELGEITDGADRDISQKVQEAFHEYEKDEVAKALDKLQDAWEKVDDGVEKGLIIAPARADAIREAIAALGTVMGA